MPGRFTTNLLECLDHWTKNNDSSKPTGVFSIPQGPLQPVTIKTEAL